MSQSRSVSLLLCLLALPAMTAWAADAPAKPAETSASTSTPASAQPVAASSAQSSVPPPRQLSAQPPVRTGNDQLVLDPTLVTGNRELPKVMYIVPWKKAELGELPAQPFNTLLDEALTPVDREVFQRQVQYYGVIAGKDQPAAATPEGGKN